MQRLTVPLRRLALILMVAIACASHPLAAAAQDDATAKASPLSGLIKPRATSDDDRFLPVEQAFRLNASLTPTGIVELRFEVAPGYYLYRDRIKISAADPATTLGTPSLPAGITHEDSYFGPQQIYREAFVASVPVTAGSQPSVKVVYQGCAEAGLCYPPQTQILKLGRAGTAALTTGGGADAGGGAPPSEQARLAKVVASGSLLSVLGVFFAAGLLLAFTPCVLPMIPILSGIIAGDGPRGTPLRSFMLSLCYVLGMAVTYTAAGAASALAGSQAQAVFQQPWIIVAFALLFIALAASMFGFYELQMPSALQTRFAMYSTRFRGGKFVSTALIGALSSLVVTACVAPPLVAALTVIAQTGHVGRGAAALFALSIGMGTPLLLVGASGGRLLPKAGPWMVMVKSLFGVVFLGVAAWMLERLLPHPVSLMLYAIVAASLAFVLVKVGVRGGSRPQWRLLGSLACAGYGLALLVGAATGAEDPLHPLARTSLFGATAAASTLEFRHIKTTGDLERELNLAAQDGKPVMLDFYADWCVSCKEMDRLTFRNPSVGAALRRYRLLQADVTANDADDKGLLKRFGIIGPPTTAFFAADGKERRDYRLVGYTEPAAFEAHLQSFERAP